jgi:hypothetical protein
MLNFLEIVTSGPRSRESVLLFDPSQLTTLLVILKWLSGGGSEDEPADVREVSHSTGLHPCYRTGVKELDEKPYSD